MASTLLERLRALPAAGPVVTALTGEPDVWVVGGAVRDLLLGGAPSDLDLVVEGDALAVARRAAERLGGEMVAHERFGTATVRATEGAFDLAGARREIYEQPGALPAVELGATLEEDLARRDFTVNTLALRLADGELAGGPGAREDLDARVLRVLHDGSFGDDPTRLLRLARYAGRLGFTVEPHTAALARLAVAVGALGTVSGERLGAELRLLAREPQPAALLALERFGLGAALLPGFAVDPGYVSRALAIAPPDARADLVALGAATHGDAQLLRARLDELGFPSDERHVLVACASLHFVLDALEDDPDGSPAPSDVRRVLLRKPVELAVLAAAVAGTPAADRARRWIDEWRHLRLSISGHDLLAAGLQGPAVGAGLEAAAAALLDGRASTREAQLAAALATT